MSALVALFTHLSLPSNFLNLQSIFPSDRAHLQAVMKKIKADKAKDMRAAERKIEQRGGALQGIEIKTIK
jgi:hypothetical protein